MALTSDQLEFWNDNGYLAIEGVLSSDEIEEFRRALDRLTAKAGKLTESTDRFKLQAFGDGGGSLIQQIAEPHELAPEWMALSRDDRILDVIEELLGGNILLYYSMLMMKPARQGFRAPWHQDFAFFVHDRAALVAVQLYLDNSTLENGCIHVVPGSHKLGLLNHFRADGTFTEIVEGDTTALDAQQVGVPIEAGGMVLWHALTLHSSPPNRSEHARRAIVFEYKDPSARLLGGSFSPNEIRPAGLIVRGHDPTGALLSVP